MSVRFEDGKEYDRATADISHDKLRSAIDRIISKDVSPRFCANPADYEWRYVAQKKMLVPYNCNENSCQSSETDVDPQFPNRRFIRWETYNVLIVEGTLRAGESNILARRLFYIDKSSWSILYGEGYDRTGNVVRCYLLPKSALLIQNKQGRWFSLFLPLSNQAIGQ